MSNLKATKRDNTSSGSTNFKILVFTKINFERGGYLYIINSKCVRLSIKYEKKNI